MGSMLPYIAAPWILWDMDVYIVRQQIHRGVITQPTQKKTGRNRRNWKNINQYIQAGAPKIAKLVYNSNNYGL